MTIRPSGRLRSGFAVLRGRLTFANPDCLACAVRRAWRHLLRRPTDRQPPNRQQQCQSIDAKNNSLTSTDVKNGSLQAGDFAAGQLPAGPEGDTGPKGDTGATGPPGPQGPAGSAQGYAVVGPNGAITTQGGSFENLVVTRISTGTYCLGQSGGSTGLNHYGPLIATLHGQDGTDGFISANLEFGSLCDPYGGRRSYQ
jgi:hypothetical protein